MEDEMKKYKTRRRQTSIEEVEIIRETDFFVYLPAGYRKSGERRESKNSEYENYFDTWEQAHASLLNRAENKVGSARIELSKAESELQTVQGMKP
jgi:hypothetical protein